MKAILSFFKDLLLIGADDKGIGLSHLKYESVNTQPTKSQRIKNVTLTDLMRKAE